MVYVINEVHDLVVGSAERVDVVGLQHFTATVAHATLTATVAHATLTATVPHATLTATVAHATLDRTLQPKLTCRTETWPTLWPLDSIHTAW
jgi:hypothetical protein